MALNARKNEGLYVAGKCRRFAVYNKSSVRVSRFFTSEANALVDLDNRLKAVNITKRNCMTCGQEFDSEGIHNRRCLKCKNNTSDFVIC